MPDPNIVIACLQGVRNAQRSYYSYHRQQKTDLKPFAQEGSLYRFDLVRERTVQGLDEARWGQEVEVKIGGGTMSCARSGGPADPMQPPTFGWHAHHTLPSHSTHPSFPIRKIPLQPLAMRSIIFETWTLN